VKDAHLHTKLPSRRATLFMFRKLLGFLYGNEKKSVGENRSFAIKESKEEERR